MCPQTKRYARQHRQIALTQAEQFPSSAELFAHLLICHDACPGEDCLP
jgi:hypothetical protein